MTPNDLLQKLIDNPSESSQQKALFAWAALPEVQQQFPELKWLFAIPNGFYSTPAQKNKMKAEGLRSGVADIFLPVKAGARYSYSGLFLEMKRVKGGVLSDEQDEFRMWVSDQGYAWQLAKGFEEARQIITDYLTQKV